MSGAAMTFTVGTESFAIDRYPMTPGTAPRPVVLMVHGLDGLSGTSGVGIRKFAEEASDAGFLVLVPRYFGQDDGPDSAPLPELVAKRVPRDATYRQRIAAAVDRALHETDADRNRLGLVGFSLGGGQVLTYAHAAPTGYVKAVVNFFGFANNPAVFAHAEKLPPTLVLHNNGDLVVPASISRALVGKLDQTAVQHEGIFYDDANPLQGNHPFKSGGAADIDSRKRTIDWLSTYV